MDRVPNNQNLWIEVKRSPERIRYQHVDPGIYQKYPWQAMFACQIGVPVYKEREKFRWGFSAAFLLEEAIDRQKLFIESQLSINPIDEHTEQRTLGLRCICVPNVGLRLGLVAKVLAASQEEALLSAQNYCRELEAVFPYDYVLLPASTDEEFLHIVGRGLIRQCNSLNSIAQIRRFESPLRTSKGVFRLIGLWQTGLRSDEQIWRALASSEREILLNISIRPTHLFEGERRALLAMKQSAQASQDEPSDEPYLQDYEAWIDPFISRHTYPWNKYFYLQIHLAAPKGLDGYIFRSIGSAITREQPDKATPGFQVIYPQDIRNVIEWRNYLDDLEIIHTNNSLLLPRLSELASLDEAHAVFRLPYPPAAGLPNTEFISVIT
jgi:hypothetical protein